MALDQTNVHYIKHSSILPIERCSDQACVQEAWGLDIDVLAYSIIDCVLMNDDDAIEAAPRISMAYAERMQSRDARRARIAAGFGEALSGADAPVMVSGDGGVDPGNGNHGSPSVESGLASRPSPDAAHLSFRPDPMRCWPGCPHQTTAR